MAVYFQESLDVPPTQLFLSILVLAAFISLLIPEKSSRANWGLFMFARAMVIANNSCHIAE
jgi:uncharacterized membrane protein